MNPCPLPPFCSNVPFVWGNQPDGLTYPANFGPGGQAQPRYAQRMTDGRGWFKQLGAITTGNIELKSFLIAGAVGAGAYAFAKGTKAKRRNVAIFAASGVLLVELIT